MDTNFFRRLPWWTLAVLVVTGFANLAVGQPFTHPGLLHTAGDFARMQSNHLNQPWVGSWNRLISNPRSQTTWSPRPAGTVIRGGTGQNYGQFFPDVAAAYQSALRYKITGDTAYANQSIRIMNAWSATMTNLSGNADRFLAAGLYGYEFCQAAEMMRDYSGWAASDFTRFKDLMVNVFYPLQHDFLVNHNSACIDNYWANRDLCNIAGIAAIGILCDDRAKYNEALDYFKTGAGQGSINRSIPYLYPGTPTLGQGQEEGRDQGHSGLDVALWGVVCQQFYNQGDDMFAYSNNRVLAACEYFAQYNINTNNTVPFTTFNWGNGQNCAPMSQSVISSNSRGDQRPVWDLIYNHYQVLKGIYAPNSAAYAVRLRPDGGGGDYGTASGGFDQLGYTTLTCTLSVGPPPPPPAAPTGLTAAAASSGQINLSWTASAGANYYYVKRATMNGGLYTNVAMGVTGTYYNDSGLAAATTFYYAVSAVNAGGESANSEQASGTTFALTTLAAYLKFNETGGTNAFDSTTNGWSGRLVNGATFVSGYSNNAVNLSSNSSQYIALPAGVVGNLNDFTIAAWVYLSTAPGSWSRVFDFGNNTTTYMFLSPKNGANNFVRFAITTASSAGEQKIEGTATLPNNVWKHVAVTLKGSVGILYVDGAPVGTNSAMTLKPSSLGTTAVNYIGKSQWADPYFNGLVDEFRIYNGALNAGEVATFVTPLAAPAGFTAETPGNSLAVLQWNAAARASSYNVKRSTINGGPYTLLANVPGTNYSDTDLVAGTTYYYVVSAVNSVAESTNSLPVSAQLVALPESPAGLTAAPGDARVELIWNAATNATGYNVKGSSVSEGPYSVIVSNYPELSFTHSSLANGTVYYFVVSATNSAGESADSYEVSARPVSFQPVPLRLAAAGGQMQFDWPTDHTGWRLQMQTNSLANGLGTNWFTVPGAETTNQLVIPMNAASDGIFFRLVSPQNF